MKHTVINQSEIIDEEGFRPYESIKLRVNESDIEIQQGRDVISISKYKLKDVINWLHSNGCEMAFIGI